MADSKLVDALVHINLGLKLMTEYIAEEKGMQGASTDELNARSEELHKKIKEMLKEDSAIAIAEMKGDSRP